MKNIFRIAYKFNLCVVVLFVVFGCGKNPENTLVLKPSQSKIINGTEISSYDPIKKHTVLLNSYKLQNLTDKKPTLFDMCTGIIIGKRTVLTAAHCFPNDKSAHNIMEIRFTTDSKKLDAPMNYATNFYILPAYYRAGMADFDIGIIQMEKDIPADYEPISILPAQVEIKTGDTLTVAGFGITADITGYNNNSKLNKVIGIHVTDDEGTVLLIDQTQGRGACRGDSGGPAFYQFQGKLYLAGVVQGNRYPVGVAQQTCKFSGIIVKAQTYKSWITKYIL